MIKDLRAIITLFRKSSHAAEALEAVLHRLGISRGLEGIGKTRFATICTAAMSLQQCLPALRELVGNSFKFPAKKVALANLFQPGSIVGLTFEISLNRFTQVGAPIAKSIVCLESTQTNPADVYKYWIAICGSVKQVLNNPTNGFSSDDASEIYRVVNACFHEQLQDGPADCYLAAFALEPRKSLCLYHENEH
ncbi:hypothetical protein JVT61DRAFT_11244 [Boletus reticuloceps]|uniref:Uncharacterized protein n=1 Tax=Boletus reticuloceps TaxID=495285 RepID=A0A8I2YEV4_9AGAM|nr:hypothetical protein JVT61DRAFT_11244 [Boletus reticuloceps]